MAQGSNLAVLSVIGRDQKGVVARISTHLAGQSINIEDIVQRVVEGLFVMTMKIDVGEMTVSLDELVLGLKRIGEELGMETSLRLLSERPRRRVALLVSKEPHCLETLLRDRDRGLIPADYLAVLSNHEVLRDLAERNGLEFRWHPSTDKAAHFAFMRSELDALQPALVVLARYMRVLSAAAIARYPDRIVNIHHSFLPAFAGASPYRQAFTRGVKLIGATAHFVTEELDAGPIIAQAAVPVMPGDTPETLEARILTAEHRCYPLALRLIAEKRVHIEGDVVRVDGATPSADALFHPKPDQT